MNSSFKLEDASQGSPFGFDTTFLQDYPIEVKATERLKKSSKSKRFFESKLLVDPYLLSRQVQNGKLSSTVGKLFIEPYTIVFTSEDYDSDEPNDIDKNAAVISPEKFLDKLENKIKALNRVEKTYEPPNKKKKIVSKEPPDMVLSNMLAKTTKEAPMSTPELPRPTLEARVTPSAEKIVSTVAKDIVAKMGQQFAAEVIQETNTQAPKPALSISPKTPQQNKITASPPIPVIGPPGEGVTPFIKNNAAGVTPHIRNNAAGVTPQVQINAAGVAPQIQINAVGVMPHIQNNAAVVRPHIQNNAAVVTPQIRINATGVKPQIQINAAGVTPQIQINAAGVMPHIQNNAAVVTPQIQIDAAGVTPHIQRNAAGVTTPIQINAAGITPHIQSNAAGVTPQIQINAAGVRPHIQNNAQKVQVRLSDGRILLMTRDLYLKLRGSGPANNTSLTPVEQKHVEQKSKPASATVSAPLVSSGSTLSASAVRPNCVLRLPNNQAVNGTVNNLSTFSRESNLGNTAQKQNTPGPRFIIQPRPVANNVQQITSPSASTSSGSQIKIVATQGGSNPRIYINPGSNLANQVFQIQQQQTKSNPTGPTASPVTQQQLRIVPTQPVVVPNSGPMVQHRPPSYIVTSRVGQGQLRLPIGAQNQPVRLCLMPAPRNPTGSAPGASPTQTFIVMNSPGNIRQVNYGNLVKINTVQNAPVASGQSSTSTNLTQSASTVVMQRPQNLIVINGQKHQQLIPKTNLLQVTNKTI